MSSSYLYAFLLSLFLLPNLLFSQAELSEEEQKKILKQARNYLYAGEYVEAFPLYSELYKADSTNMEYAYELGIVIYEGSRNHVASKKYFEKVFEADQREGKPELFYYLGRLYHLEHNFLFALGAYNTYLVEGLPPGNLGKQREEEVLAYIAQCDEGKDLIEQTTELYAGAERSSKDITKFQIDSTHYISFENLGDEINSAYHDYGPIIMDNNEVLLFTSRRSGSTGGDLFSDGQYYEDIYMANFRNGIWAEVLNINNSDYFNGALLNTNEHNATVSISPDETQLFVYTQNHCEMVENQSGTWVAPEKFSEKFSRTKKWVSNVTISPDGKTLYVEAERYDSYGGRDLYKSTLQDDGTWGEMQNLGPRINTDQDEVSPYLLNDTVLYFSSQGHSSIGGWDVFVSHKSDTGWTTPENLGVPVNTPANEVNYMMAHDGSRAYYSSDREGGYGGFDIYTIVESKERDIDEEMLEGLDKIDTLQSGVLVVDNIEIDENGNLTTASLTALAEASEKMKKNPNLKVELLAVAETRDQAKSNAELAATALADAGIDKDRIALTFRTNEEMMAAKNAGEIPLQPKYEETIYFGSDSKLVTDWSREKKMLPLLEFLKDKPDLKIYLSGHSDHIGNEDYNLKLSKARVESVEAYLKDNGVKNPIRSEYFGESSPHLSLEEVSNDPNKLIYNRRVKIVIF